MTGGGEGGRNDRNSSLNRNLVLVNLLIFTRLYSDPRHAITRGFTKKVHGFS